MSYGPSVSLFTTADRCRRQQARQSAPGQVIVLDLTRTSEWTRRHPLSIRSACWQDCVCARARMRVRSCACEFVCTCACVSPCVRACVCACVRAARARARACVRSCVYVCLCVCVRACARARVRACILACVCACASACSCVRACVRCVRTLRWRARLWAVRAGGRTFTADGCVQRVAPVRASLPGESSLAPSPAKKKRSSAPSRSRLGCYRAEAAQHGRLEGADGTLVRGDGVSVLHDAVQFVAGNTTCIISGRPRTILLFTPHGGRQGRSAPRRETQHAGAPQARITRPGPGHGSLIRLSPLPMPARPPAARRMAARPALRREAEAGRARPAPRGSWGGRRLRR